MYAHKYLFWTFMDLEDAQVTIDRNVMYQMLRM